MKRFISRANKSIPVAWAASLLSISYFLSTILGLLRNRLISTNFGANLGVSLDTDAYFLAFKVPDFMFVLLSSGALSVTLIPIFNKRYQTGNKKSAWELTNSALNFFLIATLISSILIVIFAESIIGGIMARNLDVSAQKDAATLMRIFALNPILFSISNVLLSVQQAVGRFVSFALAPITYNIGIIVGILAFGKTFGIYGAAIGVILGAVMQVVVSWAGMKDLGFSYERDIFWRNLGFRRMLRLLPPRSLDQGMDFFLSIVIVAIAGTIGDNAISKYANANILHLAPISVIGVAISTAAYPKMTERLAQGRPDLFRKEVRNVLRVMTWISLPIITIIFFGRGYLVRLLMGEGNPVVARMLGLLTIAIIFRVIFHVFSRIFYANEDTKTPMIISLFAISLHIALALYLVYKRDFGIDGLAIAQSAVAVFEVGILAFILNLRHKKLFTVDLFTGLGNMLSATGIMGLVTYVLISRVFQLKAGDIGFFSIVPKFSIIVLISLGVYLALSSLFKIKEAEPIINKLSDLVLYK